MNQITRFDRLPDSAEEPLTQALLIAGFSRSTAKRRAQRNLFPLPVKRGAHCYYKVGDLRAALQRNQP